MDSPDVTDLIERESNRDVKPLPEGFADAVALRASEFRKLALRHGKTLISVCLVTLLMSALISFYLVRTSESDRLDDTRLPTHELFHSDVGEFQIEELQ